MLFSKVQVAFIALLNLSFVNYGFSQFQHHVELQKYWNYRYRYLGDPIQIEPLPKGGEQGFIRLDKSKIGDWDANGYFTPLKSRRKFCCNDANCSNHNFANSWNIALNPALNGTGCTEAYVGNRQCNPYYQTNPNHPTATSCHTVHYGTYGFDDGRYPGYYLLMLASEYKQLKSTGQPNEATADELWQVLNLFDRLDAQGEIVFGMSPKMDGFFIREDIPEAFIQNGEMGNDYKLIGSLFSGGWWKVSDLDFANQYVSCKTIETKDFKPFDCTPIGASGNVPNFTLKSRKYMAFSMSQDVAIRWLYGLAAVIKLCPDDNNYGFRTKSKNIMYRILNHIQNGFMINNAPTPFFGNWTIVQPDGSFVCYGGDSRIYSFYFAEIANKYLGVNRHDAISLTVGLAGAIGLRMAYGLSMPQNIFFDKGKAWSWEMNSILAQLSYREPTLNPATWHRLLWIIPHFQTARESNFSYNKHFLPKYNNGEYSDYLDEFTLGPSMDLIGAMLNDRRPYYSAQYYENILSQNCFGCNSLNLNPCESENSALQYMIMFSNYSRAFSSKTDNWALTDNTTKRSTLPYLLDRNVKNTFPLYVNSKFVGVAANPATIQAARNLTLTAKLTANAKVDFFAPHISMEPGFSTTIGATSLIEPNRMNCSYLNLTNPTPSRVFKTDETLELNEEYVDDSVSFDSVEVQKRLDDFKLEDWISQEQIDALSQDDKTYIINYWRKGNPADVAEIINANVSVFPNPTRNRFTVVVSAEKNVEYDVKMLDFNSRLVREFKVRHNKDNFTTEQIVNCEELALGVYVLVFSQNGIYDRTIKLVIQ